MTSLHDRLVALTRRSIEEMGISQAGLSRKLGLHEDTINDILCGRNEGRLSTWDTILDGINVEIGFRNKSKPLDSDPST